MNLKYIRYVLWVLVLVLGVFFWLNIKSNFGPAGDSKNIPNSTHMQLGGDFTLTSHHGKTVKNTDFLGQYMLIYFGYAFCPDICPLGLQNMSEGIKLLKRDRSEIVPIFITVDPKRDTVENLKLYASNFHPDFVMLTGSEKDIESVKKHYKVFAEPVEDSGSTDYLVDHSTMIYLMGKEGEFIQFFPHTIAPEDLAKGIERAIVKTIKDKAQ